MSLKQVRMIPNRKTTRIDPLPIYNPYVFNQENRDINEKKDTEIWIKELIDDLINKSINQVESKNNFVYITMNDAPKGSNMFKRIIKKTYQSLFR